MSERLWPSALFNKLNNMCSLVMSHVIACAYKTLTCFVCKVDLFIFYRFSETDLLNSFRSVVFGT